MSLNDLFLYKGFLLSLLFTDYIIRFELLIMKIHKLSPSQKTLGAVVCALVAGLSALVAVKMMNLHQPVITTATQTRAELPPTFAIAAKQDTHIVAASAPVNNIGLNRAFEQQPVAQASWQMAGIKAETPSIPLSEKISEYAIVDLPQNSAVFPAVGEQISLPMLHGKTLIATVESVTHFPNGDYSWSGHLQGSGSDYPVVMTYGDHSIFATITTPEGSYTMESINGLGWLYKNPAEIELSHPGAKDFLEIEAQH
jgi:hypothetical protein